MVVCNCSFTQKNVNTKFSEAIRSKIVYSLTKRNILSKKDLLLWNVYVPINTFHGIRNSVSNSIFNFLTKMR